jgi:uncharacterized membrane protein (DUF373 family)
MVSPRRAEGASNDAAAAAPPRRGTRSALAEVRRTWALLGAYERFEQLIAWALAAVIAAIVIVSLIQVVRTVYLLLLVQAFNPLDHGVFQSVFGMIMTLLIAMEFKHSIVRVALRRDSIIQVKTVVLIALIALSRKFVILDPDTPPAKIAALAGAALALGGVYWFVRERDRDATEPTTNTKDPTP